MKKLIVVFLFFALFVLSACSQDKASSNDQTDADSGENQKVIELSLGTKMPDETVEGQAFNYFADLVKEKTDGKVIVNVFPAEQLGTGTTQIDNMIMGTQDMYAEGLTFFNDYDARFDLATIPYLFRDFEHFQTFNKSEVGREIEDNLIAQGMRIINTERNFVRGPYRVLLSTKPIKSLEDIKGLKLRSPETAIYADAWSYLGANPTVIAWTETYLAMRQGTVDAVTSPISLVKGMNFAEVAPYITIINEYPQDVGIVIAESSFQKLTEEQQNHLIDAANEAGEYATKLTYESIDEDIEFLKTENNAEFIEIDYEEWSSFMKDFHNQLEEKGLIEEGIVEYINSLE